jgi:hypothetical protein
LCVEGFLEIVVGADGDGKVRKGGIAGACAPMCFVSVLLGHVAGVKFVALGDEFADWLSSVAGVIEVGQSDTKEAIPFGGSLRVWASKQVCIALEDGLAVWATMLFEDVVSVDFVACREPFD